MMLIMQCKAEATSKKGVPGMASLGWAEAADGLCSTQGCEAHAWAQAHTYGGSPLMQTPPGKNPQTLHPMQANTRVCRRRTMLLRASSASISSRL